MAPLPSEGSLEERLKALRPQDWRQQFCGQGGGGGPGGKQQQQQRGGQQQGQGQQQQARAPGSPTLLLVSASAIGAVGLIKHCPQFNRVRAAATLR